MTTAARLGKERLSVNRKASYSGKRARSGIVPGVSSDTLFRKPACACGGGCPACLSETTVQPKLQIGAPNDKYEQEADRVADQVMRTDENSLDKGMHEERSEIQSKPLEAPIIRRQATEEEEETALGERTSSTEEGAEEEEEGDVI